MAAEVDWIKGLSANHHINPAECATTTTTLVAVFRGTIEPEVKIRGEKVDIPDEYVIKIGGSERLYNILGDTVLFLSLPLAIKCGILDILIAFLSNSVYGVSRFRCCELRGRSFVTILLHILIAAGNESMLVRKRILQLIGISGACGIAPMELKIFLEQLIQPSVLSISLLQSLKLLMQMDDGVVKASPTAFFNFGGSESGIKIPTAPFPFQKEYQIFFWFRIESCSMKADSGVAQHHLVTYMDSTGVGVDVLVQSKHLVVRVGYGEHEDTVIECSDFPLSRDVWYHFCLSHTRPRMAIFAKYELTVHMDGQTVFQGPVRFPLPTNGDAITRNSSVGSGFDGQMGPIYVLAEALPQSIVQVIARHNAGKVCEGLLPWSAPDLLSSYIGPDRRGMPLSSKFCSVYHPLRHAEGNAIDVHGNLHGIMSPLTKPWRLCSVRDVVMSLGGISCLLPLFPKLLIENAQIRRDNIEAEKLHNVSIPDSHHSEDWNRPCSSGLGTTLGQILNDYNSLNNYTDSVIRALIAAFDELDDHPISLLLSIFARCIRLHRMNQEDLLNGGGIEMIEYALRGFPDQGQLLKQEGESCILAVLELRSAAQDHVALEAKITRRILCNLDIWSSASYSLQASLYSVIVANIQAQPDLFMQIVGVQSLLDYIVAYYLSMDSPGAEPHQQAVQDSVAASRAATPPRLHEADGGSYSAGRRKSFGGDTTSFRRAVTKRMSQIDSDIIQGMEDTAMCRSTYLPRADKSPAQQKLSSKKSREMSCHFDSFSGYMGAGSDENDSDDNGLAAEFDPRQHYLQHRLGGPEEAPLVTTAADAGVDPTDEDALLYCNTTQMDSAQRRALRSSIESMIMIMVARGCGVAEIRPLLLFLSKSEDYVVIEEFCQLLLCVMINENGRKIVTAITELCKGTEEFGSFLINRFFSHSNEKLRSTCAALVMHYYVRVENISPTLVNSYTRKKKGTLLAKAREKYSSMLEGQGMDRLHACGGLALMCQIFDGFKRKSSEATYAIFLDLLLASPAAERHMSPSFQAKYMELCFSSASSLSKPNALCTALSLQDVLIDESTEIKNSCALPAFFYVLTKLPMHVQEKVYVDLLSLIKHNSRNRDIICADRGWHVSLFDLVGQLMAVSEESTAHMSLKHVTEFLKQWAIYENPESEDRLLVLFSRSNTHRNSLSPMKVLGYRGEDPSLASARSISSLTSSAHRRHNLEMQSLASGAGALDMWFDIGMKIYGTLLLHALDFKGGSREVDKMIACSFDSIHGIAVSLAVLSHLLNEFTFSMQAKYKDMQRMAKSGSDEENNDATVKLENMLSVIYTLSLYMLEERQIAGIGVSGLSLGRRRLDLLQEVRRLDTAATCTWICPHEEHNVCLDCLDPCPTCKHSLTLHPKRKMSMEVVDDKLLEEMPDNDDDCAAMQHMWFDMRKNCGRPPTEENYRLLLERTASRKKSLEEDVFHPLERGYELPRGRMVVILQLLRYFDMIFWPTEGRLRNGHLMNFVPKKLTSDVGKSSSIAVVPKMSLCSAILRVSTFVLHELSPFSELADLNVRRLLQLVRMIEKMPAGSYPASDWPLVIIVHISMAFRRIDSSLEGVYQALGVVWSDQIVGDGPVEVSHAELRQLYPSDDQIELTSDNPDTVQRVNGIFNNTAGKQLITYISSLVDLLTALYESHKNLLASTLSNRAFMTLTLIVQRNQSAQGRTRSASNATRPHTLSTESTAPMTSPMRSSRSMALSRSHMRSLSNSPIQERSSPTAVEEPEPRPRQRATSMDTEEAIAFCDEIVWTFRWLREPFMKIDLLRNESIMKAIISLEIFEKENIKCFFDEIQCLKDELLEHKDIVNDYCEEISDFSDLGNELLQRFVTEEDSRRSQCALMEEVTLKASAMYWNNCLRDFEENWSPWAAIEEGKEARYALSMHRDGSMRRMMLSRNDDPPDHSEAAYLEGKLRDQQQFDGVEPEEGREATVVTQQTVVADNSFLKNTLMLTRPKISRLKSANNWDGSDDSEEEDAEEASINVTSRPEPKSFALFGTQQEEKRPLWTMQFQWLSDERQVFSADVNEIMLEQALNGTLLLTNKYLYFHPKKRISGFAVKPDAFRNRRWKLDRLTECYGRRYLLQNCGIEMFFADFPEVFFAFSSTQEVIRFFRILRKQHVPSLMTGSSLSPMHIFQQSNWTDLWKRRMITNFEYLMRLNVMAGRSYNDITQYPVMPWILADYTSDHIDLADPSVYRDLTKPVGALNADRLEEILDRYKSFGDSFDMPSFMYGSHYSSSGIVMHFLIRQEPYTSMAITLQGGRFDCPDRLFFNIKETWKCCNTSMSDVKELIPECFYLPEMFLNTSRLPLGELQDDRGEVDDVVLPRWCKGNPFEFVRLHREAMESDYVSEHLHSWIDLVFGQKQVGQAAVDACNLFHYLTYENAIDIESIEDPLQRNAMKAQVTHFGQTPSQLLSTKEHPKRLPKDECIISFCAAADHVTLGKAYCYFPPKQYIFNGEHGAIVSVQCSSDRLVAVYADFTVAYYRWNGFPDSEAIPFQLKQDRVKMLPSALYSANRRILISTFDDDLYLDSSYSTHASRSRFGGVKSGASSYFEGLFGLTSSISRPVSSVQDAAESETTHSEATGQNTMYTAESHDAVPLPVLSGNCIISPEHVALRVSEAGVERIITCGYWDFTLKVHSLDSMREICSIGGGHVGTITCIEMGADKHFVVTGSSDCTCRVWILENPTIASALIDRREGTCRTDTSLADALICVHVLWGHVSPITAIAYSHHHDIVLSGSTNGLLCVHTARRGRYVRSIREYTTGLNGKGCRIDGVGISAAGYLVAYSRDDFSICVFWINGQLLNRVATLSSITCMTISTSGQVVFCGSKNGIISVRRVWDLEGFHTFDTSAHGAVTSMALISGDQFLLIGSEDGTLKVCTDPDARWKTLQTAIQKNPLMGSAI